MTNNTRIIAGIHGGGLLPLSERSSVDRAVSPARHILELSGLVSFWDFQEPPGVAPRASGPYPYELQEQEGAVERVAEGIFGPRAVRLGQGPWLSALRATCPALNLHGPAAQVTVVAWIKRETAPAELVHSCQAVAGMWNEHGRRQYCLFLNLGIWNSAEQVGAHISKTGGPSPGHKYCMDAAIGSMPVPFNRWVCVAMSYDGHYARAYLNGRLDARDERNPYAYPGGLYDDGSNGADFTVGAVARPADVTDDLQERGHIVANRYHGLLGGLAVFRRALGDGEIAQLAALR